MNDAEGRQRLYLVRHGHVHNPPELAYGHLPRFGLDREGREQAARAGAWLARAGVAALVTSPLLRARQTARIIRETVGPISLSIDRRLRESELARVWQGLAWTEIARDHAALYSTFERTPSRITTGETMEAMAGRMLDACRQAGRRYEGQAVALISHRDPILALRLTLDGGDLDALHATPCRQGSITVLTAAAEGLRFADYVEP
jgi:broad specificity phosphatase PhoE